MLHTLFTAAFSGTLAITTGCGSAASPGDADGAGALRQKFPEQITKLLEASGAVAPGAPSVETLLDADESMNHPRAYPTATMLPNGKVLVTGGLDGTDSLSSAEIYDPQAHAWTEVAPMSMPRSLHTATLINYAQVLVGPMSAARAYHTATRLPDGKVLVVGGYNGNYAGAKLATADVYDPQTNAWTPAQSMSTGRIFHTATLLANTGEVLVTGGSDSTTLSSAEIYHPANNTWSSAESMSVARAWHTATAFNDGRVLVVGGVSSSDALSSAEIYDPATNLWSDVGDMGALRYGHSATLLDQDRVLVTGGTGSVPDALALDTTAVYDLSTNTWTSGAPLRNARTGHTATPLSDGKVVVTGGWNWGWVPGAEINTP